MLADSNAVAVWGLVVAGIGIMAAAVTSIVSTRSGVTNARESIDAQRLSELSAHRRAVLAAAFDRIDGFLRAIDDAALGARGQRDIEDLIRSSLIPLRDEIMQLPGDSWVGGALERCYRLLRRAHRLNDRASDAGTLGVVLGATDAARRAIGAARREEPDPGRPEVFDTLVAYARMDEHPSSGTSRAEFDMACDESLESFGGAGGAEQFLSAWRDRGAPRLLWDQ